MLHKKLMCFLAVIIVFGFTINYMHIKTRSVTTANKSKRDEWQIKYNQINFNKNLSDKEKLKAVTYLYFQLQYDELNKLELKNIDFMVSKNQAMENESIFRNIHIEKLKKMKDHYTNCKLTIDFKDIKITDNSAEVPIVVSCTWNYASMPDKLSSMGGDIHTLKYKRSNDTWKIEEDIYKDSLKDFLRYKRKSLEDYLDDVKQGNFNKDTSDKSKMKTTAKNALSSSESLKTYNRNAAKNYQDRYGGSTYFNSEYYGEGSLDKAHNGQFLNFIKLGGDCTNYASQVIHAGGAPFDKLGACKWYYNNANSRSNWTGVNDLWNYAVNNSNVDKGKGLIASPASPTELNQSDIIQLDIKGTGFGHSVVVYEGNTDINDITVSAHSGSSIDRWVLNVKLGDNYSWSSIRGISIMGYKQ